MLLKPQNPHGMSLRFFITQKLYQFNLNTSYSENDILHEAYLRGVALSKSGTSIQRPCAWLRKTAYNVIREHSRSQHRHSSIELDGLTELEQAQIEHQYFVLSISNALLGDKVLDVHLESVMRIWQELQPSERKIILLKYVEDLSWREVAEKLFAEEGVVQTEVALRKQGQRIMERLRRNQH